MGPPMVDATGKAHVGMQFLQDPTDDGRCTEQEPVCHGAKSGDHALGRHHLSNVERFCRVISAGCL